MFLKASMNGVMEMASEVRRTLCNGISLCGYSDFPWWVSRQHLPPIGRVIGTYYLSTEHRDSREGCALAGLAGEMARQPEPVRNAYVSALNHRLKRIAALLPGDDEKARFDRARLLVAGMAGTMMIAKAMTDRDVSDHFLQQARAFYEAAFESAPQRKATKA